MSATRRPGGDPVARRRIDADIAAAAAAAATSGVPAPAALATSAHRLDDDRVRCTDCRHYRLGRCANHRAAALASAPIGREFAALPQRCAGFAHRHAPSMQPLDAAPAGAENGSTAGRR